MAAIRKQPIEVFPSDNTSSERELLLRLLDALTDFREQYDSDREEILPLIRAQTGGAKADDREALERIIGALLKIEGSTEAVFEVGELLELADHSHELAAAIGNRTGKDLGALLKRCRGKAIGGRVLTRHKRTWIVSVPASQHHSCE